jgi:O-antigen/teichoic acid export membrane protein
LRPTIKRYALLMVLACVPPALALVALADPISLVLFDENREECRLVMQFTAWAIPTIGAEMSLGYLLAAGGRERQEARIALARAALGIVLSFGFVSTLGLLGAAIALPLKGVVGVGLRIPSVVGLLRTRPDPPLTPAPATSALE